LQNGSINNYWLQHFTAQTQITTVTADACHAALLAWNYHLEWFCKEIRVVPEPDFHTELAADVE